MPDRTDNPIVINEINTLKGVVPFGINHNGNFIRINNITIDVAGKLYYLDDDTNEKHSVSSLITRVKRNPSPRWLNHIHFINGFQKKISLKKHLSQRHGLHFT